ncbi:efflux transporter outer membrane subunit [Bradyrhizobium sp. 31Argb]|uniref:efflux transporter outer membrane subunit n=1 Tax=unclassified Bradyrhizobium TaxID=2631580 RepID=UPI00102E42EF|nr:efflux transporter outer membrane subunit [Bradyrhizobium sp. Leo170]TAI66770.1 RND transporter [Bradyrhizobium sp. Leo170]
MSALIALALGPGLSGCILGSERPELNLEVPEKYRAASSASPDAAVPVLDWWRGFGSGELTSLMDAAQISNLDVAVAVAQVVQADAQVGVAGSPLLPSLTGAASAERAHFGSTSSASSSNLGGGVTGTGGGRGGGSSNFSQFSTSLTASYMLDFWGKNQAALLAAEESATASRYNREVVTLTAIVTVANTYFQILAAQDELRVTRQNLAAAERILALIKTQFAGGTASQLDVSQQEALAGTQRAAIPPLEVTIGQNIAALAVLVGRAPANFTVRGGSTSRIKVPRVTPGLPSELLYQRPDIRQAEALLAASNFSVEQARAAFFPQIQLTGTGGFQSSALASLFTPGAAFSTLTASLAQPIFDGFLLESQLKQAKGVQLQNLQAYRKAVLSAFSDVEKALIALQKFTLQERLQAQVVASSQTAFDVAEKQLRGGTINLITVLQAEQTLFTAEVTLVQVRLSKLLAASSLFQALGGGWTPAGTLVSLQ